MIKNSFFFKTFKAEGLTQKNNQFADITSDRKNLSQISKCFLKGIFIYVQKIGYRFKALFSIF